jgi:hypothetical protein
MTIGIGLPPFSKVAVFGFAAEHQLTFQLGLYFVHHMCIAKAKITLMD